MSINWIPARKITPKERGNRGIIPTCKNPLGIVEYESCFERDFLLVAIHCPSVKLILHQYKTIHYVDKNGKDRKYTPDIYLEFKEGNRLLVEIKPEEEVRANRKKYEERWTAAQKWATSNGILFTVLTDNDIRTPRWFNIWFTIGASKCIDNGKYMEKLNAVIHPDGDEYDNLCYKLSRELVVEIGKAAQIICYAIYHGFVFVDSFASKQLSKHTVIRKLMKNNDPPFNSIWDDINRSFDNDLDSGEVDCLDDSEEQLKKISSDFKCDIKNDYDVEQREEMVLSWLRQPKIRRTVEWREEFCKNWGLSESQIYRLVRRYKKGGRNELFPLHENAGRKVQLNEEQLELIEKARNYYLKPSITLKMAHESLIQSCEAKCVESPKLSTFKKYVYRNSSRLDFANKKGNKFIKSHFTPSLKSFQGAILPMQVVQMDNTLFDVFPVDQEQRESLSTPFMTAAIDCYTRMITGFNVSYFASSSRNVIEVLVQTILPKNEYTNAYETQHNWPVEGFPVIILVDNGMDYRSNALKDFCKKYDIIIEFVPLRTPRYKAFIEQWFNVLKNAMRQESIPGLRPSLKQRLDNPDLKPENEAVLTLQEIETWLHKWVVDDYNFSNQYDDHVLAPYLKLSEAQEGRTDLVFPAPREPPNSPLAMDELNLSTLKSETRTLTRDGVLWEHLRYNSKELAEIYKTRGNDEITILRDTRDIRRIWVVNPINDKPILVGLGSGWAAVLLGTYGDKPVHESAWIRNVKLLRTQIKEKLTPYVYSKQVSEQKRLAVMENAKKQQKSIRKEREKSIETSKKSIDHKLTSNGLNDDTGVYQGHKPVPSIGETTNDEDDIFKTYKPQGLATSKYPKKE